jgi:hypothetical protein
MPQTKETIELRERSRARNDEDPLWTDEWIDEVYEDIVTSKANRGSDEPGEAPASKQSKLTSLTRRCNEMECEKMQ